MRNEVVLERASISALADMVATKRLRWFGHVSRMPEERLPNYLLEIGNQDMESGQEDDLGRL